VVRVPSFVAVLVVLAFAGGAGAAAAAAAPAPLRPGLEGNGPGAESFRCAGTWAPIQAKVSGFVVGNCRGGTVVRGIATDQCAIGCVRGGAKEGRGWEAVSLPRRAHFPGCGWINLQNRLVRGGIGRPADRCGRETGPDLVLLERYVKRFSGRRVAGAIGPRTTKYAGLYLWAGHFTSGPNRGREGGAIAYRPRLSDPARACTAYANVNPWLPGQRVRRSERMWTVHDRSRHLQIRYIARYQALNEQGEPRWWVNVHSTDPADREQPWGFVAAECIFGGSPSGAPGAARRLARGMARRSSATPPRKCGFAPVAFHEIIARRQLSCAQAKAVLRHLRGDHDLAPISCTAPRRVGGWALRNIVRDPSLGVTRYSRRGRSFDFQRHQFPSNIWCPAAGLAGSDMGAATAPRDSYRRCFRVFGRRTTDSTNCRSALPARASVEKPRSSAAAAVHATTITQASR
jgi:hypothetical protein